MSDPHLYRIWLAMPAPANAANMAEAVETRPASVPSHKASAPGWLERLQDLFSWPSLIPLSCGLMLGLALKFGPPGVGVDSEPGLVQVQPPLDAPQKASRAEASTIELTPLHECVALEPVSANAALCVSRSWQRQAWYVVRGQASLQLLDSPLPMDRVHDLVRYENMLLVLSEQNARLVLSSLVLNSPVGAEPAAPEFRVIGTQAVEGRVDGDPRIMTVRSGELFYRSGGQTYRAPWQAPQ
jgi:hypothetical protein